MKTNHFFWGVFLTVIGLLFLIDSLFSFNIDVDYFLRLWPLILILIGLKLLIKNSIANNVIVFISAVLLALIVYGFIFNPFSCGRIHIYRDMKKEKSESISHFYSPKIKNAKLDINFDLGNLKIDNLTEKLIDGELKHTIDDYKFDGEISDTTAFFFLKSESSNKKLILVLPSKKEKNQLDLHLNQNPNWDIRMGTNISDFDLDLSSINSKELKVESNFSSGKIKLGQPLNETLLFLDLNFTKLDLDLPNNANVEVIVDKNFSSIDVSGLERIEKNIYRSKNFDRSKNHFVIEISSNFSSINIY